MCRFQCNQQCCPIKQIGTSPAKLQLDTDVEQLQQQFARNNNVKFFSPDSSDESEDDEQHHHHQRVTATTAANPNQRNYNFIQSCHDNFFQSFHDPKFVANSCQDDNASLESVPSSDSESSIGRQNDDSGEEDTTNSSRTSSSSSLDGSFTLKSILSAPGTKRSSASEKHAYKQRVSFADRWGIQLVSYRTIPSRHVDLRLFDALELDFNEVNFPDDDASDYWRSSVQKRSKLQTWSFGEPENLA